MTPAFSVPHTIEIYTDGTALTFERWERQIAVYRYTRDPSKDHLKLGKELKLDEKQLNKLINTQKLFKK